MDFLANCSLKPTIWFRFLDDIFLVWNYSLTELDEFISNLNEVHNTIKFTHNVSDNNVSYLDVNVIKNKDNTLSTDIHIKPTDVHQYLEYNSCHPNKCKDGIPYSQAKRYRRIISDDEKFKESLSELKKYFLNRNYPEDKIKCAFDKVSSSSQDEALVNKHSCAKNNTIIPYVIPYNTTLPNIGLTLNKYWNLLNLSEKDSVKYLHNYKPVIAYKRPKNLQDSLTHSTLKTSCVSGKSNKCNRSRCTHCKSIIETNLFNSTTTGETFKLRVNGNCASSDVIYLITCKKCKIQYVGQTGQLLSKRMNSHRFDIKSICHPSFSSNVALHFNEHSPEDFAFMPIDYVSDNMKRLLKETYWIHKLDTLHPKGLNAKSLYNI